MIQTNLKLLNLQLQPLQLVQLEVQYLPLPIPLLPVDNLLLLQLPEVNPLPEDSLQLAPQVVPSQW